MSADNGIYIAQFPDGFRVIEAQAIENLNYFEPGTAEWKAELDSYYGGAPLFNTQAKARHYANILAGIVTAMDFLEYGVSDIGFFDYIPVAKEVLK